MLHNRKEIVKKEEKGIYFPEDQPSGLPIRRSNFVLTIFSPINSFKNGKFDKAKYHAGFCGDISKEEADFMYASQGAFYAKGFTTPITHAAWRDKPTFGCIATEDKSINPDIQRAMYKRSNTKATDVKGIHVINGPRFLIFKIKWVAIIENKAGTVEFICICGGKTEIGR